MRRLEAPWPLEVVQDINRRQKKAMFPIRCPQHDATMIACSSELYCPLPHCPHVVTQYFIADKVWPTAVFIGLSAAAIIGLPYALGPVGILGAVLAVSAMTVGVALWRLR
jgi:hypothetical protein